MKSLMISLVAALSTAALPLAAHADPPREEHHDEVVHRAEVRHEVHVDEAARRREEARRLEEQRRIEAERHHPE